MILEWMDTCAGALRRAARRSRLIAGLCRFPRKEEGKPSAMSLNDVRKNRRFRFHRRVMRWQEKSLVIGIGRRCLGWILRSSIGSIGICLLTFGALSLAGSVWKNGGMFASWRLLIPIGAIVSSVPLLASFESCAEGICKGRILGGFLLGFCGLSESFFMGEREGIERRWQPLLFGAFLALTSTLTHPVLALLLLLLPISTALLMVVPELAAVGICLLLPFFNLVSHPTVCLLLALTAGGVAWLGKAVSGKRQSRFTGVDLAVLLFALSYALGGIASFGGSVSAMAGGMKCMLLLLSWFPMRALLSSSLWRKRAIRAFLLSTLAVSLLGVWQYFSGRAELAWVDLARFSDIGGRVCSVFENPNLLAVYLLLTVPSALGGLLGAEGLPEKIFCAAVFLSGSLCLLLTWSRGAWLGWILAVFLFFLLYSRRSLSCMLLSPLPLFTAALYLPRSVWKRFGSIGYLAESSTRYRLYTWQGVYRMLSEHPFGIGVGDSAFHSVFPYFAVSGTERVMHAHNLFLQIAAEVGLPSLLILLLVLWRLLRRTAFTLRVSRSGRVRAELLGVATALAGALLMGQFDHIWYHGGTFCLFWMLMAVLFDLCEREGGSR